MKNTALVLAALTAFAPMTTLPAFADGHSVTKYVKVLPGLCPASVEGIREWARGVTAIAAYAVPTTLDRDADCDIQGSPVTAGQAFNSPSVEEASSVALATCEAHRTDSYGPCVVIATMTTR